MLLGYARVSTDDQKLDLQHDALLRAGCEKIFDETVSGAAVRLPVRQELLDFARPADTLVVFKLDRLGRSLRDLIELVNALAERGVGLLSLRESIDTTTPAAKLTFHVFAALADYAESVIMPSWVAKPSICGAGVRTALRIITAAAVMRSGRRGL